MDKLYRSKKFKTLLPYFLLALAIIAANRIIGELGFFADALGQAWRIITPFFYGFLLAYIVNIPCSGIQRVLAKTKIRFILKRQRMLSLFMVFILLAVLVAVIITLIAPTISNSIVFFIANIPVYWESVLRHVDDFNNRNLFGWYISVDGIFNLIRDFFSNIRIETLSRPIDAILGAGATVFSGFITFISSIYILIEKDKFKAFIRRLLKVMVSWNVYNAVLGKFGRLNENFRQYIRTQTIDGIILGTLATVVLFILGSPYALVLGIMLGIVNYIPYFGSIFGTLAAVIVVAFTQGITMGLASAAILFAVQQIDANVIQPKLMSGSFALSPLLVIISITIGGALAGIFGMIAAIPIVAVLKDILDSIIVYYERKKEEPAMAKLQVFYDYLCPYCKTGHEYLQKEIAAYPDIEIEWRPVESHPEPEDYHPHTHLACQSYYAARELGADMDAFHTAMYRAVVDEGRNVEKAEVIAEVLKGIVDTDRLRGILESGRYAKQVDENNELAFEKSGVWFVPAFRMNGNALDAKGGVGVTAKELRDFLTRNR